MRARNLRHAGTNSIAGSIKKRQENFSGFFVTVLSVCSQITLHMTQMED